MFSIIGLIDRQSFVACVMSLAFFYLCLLGSEAIGQHVPNQNKFSEGLDQHGLGFGLIDEGSPGVSLYYDFNLPQLNKQAHIQYDSAYDERSSLLGVNTTKLGQTALHASFRHVYDSGWYLGIAAGWYNTTVRMEQLGSNATQKDQSLYFYERGFILGPEFGWQGNDFYYFSVGLCSLGRNEISNHYDLNEVYDISNHRETVAELWKQGKQYSRFYIGFGWYLKSSEDETRASKDDKATSPSSADPRIFDKAKKCQAKGGVWVNDMCRLEVE